MAEPVTLYPIEGGDPVICAAPSEVQRLLDSGGWQLEPAPEKPKPSRRKSTSKPSATKDK
jgi:hypothetical protein